MDEPTAALAIKEVGKVLDLIKRLKDHGVARHPDQPPHGRHLLRLRPGDGAVPRRATSPRRRSTETSRNEVIGWIMGTKGHTALARP